MHADPVRAEHLIRVGRPLRTGRKIGRTLYVQIGDNPENGDLLIGVMDSQVIAEWVAMQCNIRLGGK